MDRKQKNIDKFYSESGPCCAGCDWWRWHNTLVGDCIKSAPVSSSERISIIDISLTDDIGSGHIITPRGHYCGDFKDEGLKE